VNLLLLEAGEIDANGRACIGGRRAEHVRAVLRARPGQRLRAGIVGGGIGEAVVETVEAGVVKLVLGPREEASPLALPHVLALQQATAMGVKRIVFFRADRTERSYLGSHALREGEIREQVLLGLEQARDTVLPRVEVEPRFAELVGARLPGLPPAWVAERGGRDVTRSVEPRTLVVGPEGGFSPRERELLAAAGHPFVGLGPRTLRVETAVVALLARAMP
jgi:RsmE family RNA methyltransferase